MSKGKNLELENLLKLAVHQGASDVHIKAGIVPVMRKHGKLRPIEKSLPALTPEAIDLIISKMMNAEQLQEYKEKKELDLGYGVPGLGRFRVNAFRQRGTPRLVIRTISHEVPKLEDLNLPSILDRIANHERGLVLVTGATGSGKSSTLAAIIDHINRTKNKHILTIEDPIEYLIRDRRSIITQRELGVDARDFTSALRAALRQDPDVILIGEMRDKETIETALTAAETGHLVLSTLHTLDCQESINRILSVFEPHKQQQVRLQLGAVLKAIISQRLANRIDGQGFVPAVEILVNNARIREMIEKPERTKEINGAIEEGQVSFGMQTFDQSLMALVTNQVITYDEAMRLSDNGEDFSIKYSGISREQSNRRDNTSTDHEVRVENAWDRIEDVEMLNIQDTPPEPEIERDDTPPAVQPKKKRQG